MREGERVTMMPPRFARAAIFAIGLALLCRGAAHAAEAPLYLSLDDAVVLAMASHPHLRAAAALAEAARAQVAEARARELPEGGIAAQLSRSTGNAIPGTFLPTPGFASISGSPRGRGLAGDAWQSGVSLWAAWDATGLAVRLAEVDAALAARAGADAALRAARLEIAFQVSEAFLAGLAAEAEVRAAQASVERARTFASVVEALVQQNLRPGADAARVEADLSLALTQVARAEEARATRLARLAELIGRPGCRIELKPGGLLRAVGDAPPFATEVNAAAHPLVEERAALARRARAIERATRFDYLPRVDLVAALWARGSGYYPGGLDAAAGAVPDTPNWAAGVVVSWPFLDIPILRARARVAGAQARAALARRDEVALQVTGQFAEASAMLEGARRVARNTPIALASARTAETQAIARYRAALSTILDVADAQRVLAEAELEEYLARLQVRRAILYLARASGDLDPFFADARRTPSAP